MRKLRKSVDSPKNGLESANPSLAQEITSNFPKIINGAFSRRNTNVLTSTGKFILLPFLNWRFLKLVFALIAFYLLIQADASAQAYQEYPISPPLPSESTAPKYSPEDTAIIKNHSQQIISNHQIKKGDGNIVVCDLFMKDSRIIAVGKIGSYWKVKVQFRDYTTTYFFKASRYDLGWIRIGMRTDKSERNKRYARMIQTNKERIAAHNQAVRDSIANENRSFISKIINPND